MQIKYKYYILSILLSLWTAVGWAQTPQIDKNWILNANESSASKAYVAGESITLKSNGTTSGFSFQAVSGKSFSAKIDPALLFPPTDKTYAVKASDGTISYNSTSGAVVGSIPGQFAVGETGAVTTQSRLKYQVG